MRRGAGRPLRGAIVGYGFIAAQGHLPAYQARDDVEIVAVADVCPPRRALAAARLPGAATYASAEALLAAEGRRLDFVDVATPPCDHAPIAHLALDRGVHVLCEKPLATRAADARALLEHAARARRVIFPAHNYRHAPAVRAITEVIRSGDIGRVHSVTVDTFRNTHARGVPEWNPDWRRHVRWSGGGIAMDHGSHAFYLTFDWLDAWPVSVTAKTANSEPSRWDTEDTYAAVVTFPRGIARVHLTWNAGVRKVVYTIHGERGAITVVDDDVEISAAAPAAARRAAHLRLRLDGRQPHPLVQLHVRRVPRRDRRGRARGARRPGRLPLPRGHRGLRRVGGGRLPRAAGGRAAARGRGAAAMKPPPVPAARRGRAVQRGAARAAPRRSSACTAARATAA